MPELRSPISCDIANVTISEATRCAVPYALKAPANGKVELKNYVPAYDGGEGGDERAHREAGRESTGAITADAACYRGS